MMELIGYLFKKKKKEQVQQVVKGTEARADCLGLKPESATY